MVTPTLPYFLTFLLTLSSLEIMVNICISTNMKECALSLWDRGWDILGVIDTLGVSQRSLY